MATPTEEEARARFAFEQEQLAKQTTPKRATRADLAAKRRERAEAKYQSILAERGPAAQARAEEARNTPLWDRTMLMAGQGTDKLLAGSADIGDFLGDVIGLEGMPERTRARAADQAEKDILFREMSENAGLGNVGAVLPYGVTGLGITPATKAGYSAVASQGGKAVKATGRGVGGAIVKGTEQATRLPGRTGRLAKRFKKETIDPKVRYFEGVANRTKVGDPGREGIMKTLMGDLGTGMIEGGLHYDLNPIEGGLASLAGSATGLSMRPLVSRAPDVRTKPFKEDVAWGEHQGMRFMPGMKTGSKRHQTFEAGLRNDRRYMNTFKLYDDANDAAMNRVVYKSMGMLEEPPMHLNKQGRAALFKEQDEMIRGITPEQLDAHLKNQKAVYQELEATTTGKLNHKKIVDFDNKANKLLESESPMDRSTGREMKATLQEMKANYAPRKTLPEGSPTRGHVNRRGRKQGHKVSMYDGTQYQQMRTNLTNKMNTAYEKNKTMYYSLKEMRDELDESLKRGMGEGSEKLKAWKDANEKFAMTKIVMENGMDTAGRTDLNKLSQHFLSQDNQRYLTRSGGDRITDLHRAASLRAKAGTQAGSQFTSDLIPAPKHTLNPWQSFLSSPVSKYTMPLIPRAYFGLYAKGYPSRTGLLGMQNTMGEHLYELPGMTRAVAQTSQIHPWLAGQAMDGVNSVIDAGKATSDSIYDAYNWLDDQWKGEERP